jgi:transposase-like protein
MKRKRKQYSGAFKAKIGLEAVIGIKTTAQIARENGVHPLLVGQWKAIIRERLPELFERGNQRPEDSERLIAQLHQKIGELTVDLDWLKKKSRQLGLSLRDEN